MTFKNILAFFVGLSLLIGVLILGYRYVIYIPGLEKQRLDNEYKIERDKILYQQQLDEEKRINYDNCMAEAEVDYLESWLNRCRANGIPVFLRSDGKQSCSLYDSLSAPLREERVRKEGICLEVYKSE